MINLLTNNSFLKYTTFSEIFEHPNDTGITIFISGFLITLSLYHFILYFQHRDKAYLYYSTYTFLIFIYSYHRAHHFFLADLSLNFKDFFHFNVVPLQWAFNTLYLEFVKTFINLKEHRPKWNKFLNYAISFYLIVLLFIMIYSYVANNTAIMGYAYAYFFLPTISIIAIITMYVLFKMDTYLKYYVLLGSSLYLSLSLTAFYLSFSGKVVTSIFYTAVFVENIFFALGLGSRQKKILLDKNIAQNKVIKEHIANIELQNKIKTKLNKEVAIKTKQIMALTKKNEEEHKKKMASDFSKHTLDLRMKALQTQMNPHFLFNSLNSLKHYIFNNKKEKASFFLGKLSKLLREILDNSQLREISLKKELSILQLYLDVENLRLGNQILLRIKIAENIDTEIIKLPPLVLQPFIENAIWHALALKKGEKIIKINIIKENKSLIIYIEDNGIGREQAALHKDAKLIEKESLGIKLSKQRLQAYTEHLQKDVTITFEDLYEVNTPSGTKIIIKFPIQ